MPLSTLLSIAIRGDADMVRIKSRSVTKAGVTLVLGAMLGGCAGFDAHFAEYDKEYRLQPGDVLVLETELAFPKDHARVKMQGDGPVGGVDEYHPYCEMEVTVVSDGGFKLLPDRFAVWKFSEQILPGTSSACRCMSPQVSRTATARSPTSAISGCVRRTSRKR